MNEIQLGMLHSKARCDCLISPAADGLLFGATVLFPSILTPLLYLTTVDQHDVDLPLWVYLPVIVGLDVGHTWATYVRGYMDSAQRGRHSLEYLVLPPVLAVVMMVGGWLDAAVTWNITGYLAIAQCFRQHWGLVSLYRRKTAEPSDAGIDFWTLAAGLVCPVALWHADVHRSMDWFMLDVPLLVQLPGWTEPLAILIWSVTGLVYVARQAVLYANGHVNFFKCLCMANAWLSWGVGILIPHRVLAILFLVLPHAIPSYVVALLSCRARWRSRKPAGAGGQFAKWLTTRWWTFVGFLVAVAVVEEILWEVFVWREWTHDMFTLDFNTLGHQVSLALLGLPQTVHYCLELLLWDKTWGHNAEDWWAESPGASGVL
eukprot:TRINITY_DN17047_c0_g1_i1.p1 TRINITY_DN17047_c0_g1~~TRINITY_DN17047_c0_g1_i1.p1  ORF type:complete len:374 (+),score=27.53 TRINITY_DN17047_c0_g1_i1:58-1179(+)